MFEASKLKRQLDQVKKGVRKHDSDIGELKTVLDDAKTLLGEIDRRSKGTDDLVKLGFIVLVLTALGIAIAFLNLTVDVYHSQIINAIPK